MPTPDPTPTAAQIVIVAEIAMVTVEFASSMISAHADADIVDAQWAATLADIARWAEGIGTDTGDVKRVDQIEFFEKSNVAARLDIRNSIRLRYGLPYLSAESAGLSVDMASLQWFHCR